MYKIEQNARCAVIGYGSWATAIVKILLENEPSVTWYIRRRDVIEDIEREGRNPRYLQDVHFDTTKLSLTDDINYAVSSSDIIIMAVPSAFLKDTLAPLNCPLSEKFVISAIKGIIPDNYVTIAEYLNESHQVAFDNIGIIAGPCHSEEVALERLSYLTLVAKSPATADILCSKFRTDYINTIPSTDIYGTEYASVLKNIYAICAGLAVGLGYGDNFLSVLISNAAIEMNRFLSESFPAERDTNSSAYLGDLLVTCYSQFSRNRTFGTMIGKGYSIESAIAGMSMVAEGYYSSECIWQVNKKLGIHMPIAECVHRILYEGFRPVTEIKRMTKKLI